MATAIFEKTDLILVRQTKVEVEIKMNSIQLKTFNRLGSFSKRISNHYICDPYSTMIHYRRAFKFLKGLDSEISSALILGNKNQTSIRWEQAIRRLDTAGTRLPGRVDKAFLATG